MDVKIKPELSSVYPDEIPIQSARGDYLDESLIGMTTAEALEETGKSESEFIEHLIKIGHFGPFEHGTAYFAFEDVSIVVERQMTRHRHLSFDIQSLRYVDISGSDVEEKMKVPQLFEDGETISRGEGHVQLNEDDAEFYTEEILNEARRDFRLYENMVDNGVPPELARYSLPMGLTINGTMSGNMRSLMHIIDIRDAGDVQPETQRFAGMVFDELKRWAPKTFTAYEQFAKGASKGAP